MYEVGLHQRNRWMEGAPKTIFQSFQTNIFEESWTFSILILYVLPSTIPRYQLIVTRFRLLIVICLDEKKEKKKEAKNR